MNHCQVALRFLGTRSCGVQDLAQKPCHDSSSLDRELQCAAPPAVLLRGSHSATRFSTMAMPCEAPAG